MNGTVLVNGKPVKWQEGLTINKILEIMNYSFKMLVVKVNGDLVRKSEFNEFTVPVGAEIKIIHLISGG